MIVCAASNNVGKLKELRRILERMGHEVKSLRELGITLDPEETGTTFAENARIKAEAFCKASGLPTVADDSGLCTDALHGAPGVYSARYAGHHGDDDANNEKLLREMADVPEGQRGARFVSPSALCCRTAVRSRSRASAPAKSPLRCRTATTASAMIRCSSPMNTAPRTESAPTPRAAAMPS